MRRLLRILLAEPSPWLVIAAAAVVLVLVGCAEKPFLRDAFLDTATVRVVWSTPEQIARTCVYGLRQGETAAGCIDLSTNVIYARRPTSWADWEAFFVIGHELYHALGARHE